VYNTENGASIPSLAADLSLIFPSVSGYFKTSPPTRGACRSLPLAAIFLGFIQQCIRKLSGFVDTASE
jgi:hypothetical protein